MDKKFVRFVAVGDVTLGDHPVCFGHGVRSTIEKHGFDYIFKNISQELSNADILFGNLESVLTDDAAESRSMNSLEFRGKTSNAKELAQTGFIVMSVANNHAMQHGIAAFEESVEALRCSSITPVGITENDESNCSYPSSYFNQLSNRGIYIDLISIHIHSENGSDTIAHRVQ